MSTALRLAASAALVLSVTAACGGAKETELFGALGAGSSGASGSSGGDSGTGSSGTSGSSSDGGTSGCRAGKTDCKDDEYCQLPSCSATSGVCTKKPTTESGMFTPVCGCDQITYWNKELAAAHGISIAGSSACASAGALGCSSDAPCPDDAKCHFDRVSKLRCTVATLNGGKCWILPKTCPPPAGAATRVRACSNDACTSLCQAIDDEVPTYSGGACN